MNIDIKNLPSIAEYIHTLVKCALNSEGLEVLFLHGTQQVHQGHKELH